MKSVNKMINTHPKSVKIHRIPRKYIVGNGLNLPAWEWNSCGCLELKSSTEKAKFAGLCLVMLIALWGA